MEEMSSADSSVNRRNSSVRSKSPSLYKMLLPQPVSFSCFERGESCNDLTPVRELSITEGLLRTAVNILDVILSEPTVEKKYK